MDGPAGKTLQGKAPFRFGLVGDSRGNTEVFETTLAMFFSLVFKSSVQSMITGYAVLLVLFGAPVAADQILGVVSKIDRAGIANMLFISPFEAIYSVTTKTIGENAVEAKVVLWPQYLALYAGLSLLCMALVYIIFTRRCRHTTKTT